MYHVICAQIYTDRHYTSTDLVHAMCAHKTYWVGTVMSHNRSKLPKDVMKGAPQADRLPKSHSIWRSTSDGKWQTKNSCKNWEGGLIRAELTKCRQSLLTISVITVGINE
ncbi:MAG: hypothetical protein GY820_24225 [Gammaproteobacteria bacterium]|nr:hypothetical protein [Gammaproteobacteria bacterium]